VVVEEVRLIQVKEGILSEQNRLADELRDQLRSNKTFLLNLMSSPGAGKTSLILQTAEALRDEVRMAVIEADIDSVVDAEKVAAHGIDAIQLRTGGFCHLDASMVAKGLDALDLHNLDFVIIENVGNLVCPAEFDTGAIRNAMILSVPEGDDKPLKYPLMFTVCDVLLVNKIDYLDYADFDLDAMKKRVLALNPKTRIIETSCTTGEGIRLWRQWLRDEIRAFSR
jgi:hydrogenase nickel incorporation protein HypB